MDIYIRHQNHVNVSMAPDGREQVRLQCPIEGALRQVHSGDHSAGGRRFHVAGTLTAKLRRPVAV